jgi:hypothetical protein
MEKFKPFVHKNRLILRGLNKLSAHEVSHCGRSDCAWLLQGQKIDSNKSSTQGFLGIILSSVVVV